MPEPLSQRASKRGTGAPGGGGGGPNVIYTDDAGISDSISMKTSQPDDVGIADKLTWASALTDDVGFSDSLAVTSVATVVDDVGARDSLVVPVTWGPVARSATPDTDAWGDAWTDSTVGNTGINHGADAQLSFDGLAVAVKTAFLEFDFTRLAGFQAATGGTHRLLIAATTTLLVAVTAAWNVYAQAARWFIESTITQANQPNPAGPVASGTFAIPASSTAFPSLTLTESQLNGLIGKWVLVKITGNSVTDSGTVSSREGPNVPAWSFSLAR